jgi:hypothetical protein
MRESRDRKMGRGIYPKKLSSLLTGTRRTTRRSLRAKNPKSPNVA